MEVGGGLDEGTFPGKNLVSRALQIHSADEGLVNWDYKLGTKGKRQQFCVRNSF